MARSDGRLSLCARGEDDCRVDPEGKVKSISSETALDKDTAELDRLRPIPVRSLPETVVRRLKKAGLAGKDITLKLKTSDFRIVTRSSRLKSATQSEEGMFQAAEPLLVHETDGRAFRLIGIGAHDLVAIGQVIQGDLFSGFGPVGSKVDKALDAVREKIRGRRHRQGPRLRDKAQSAGDPRRWSESDGLQHAMGGTVIARGVGRARSSSISPPVPSFRPLQYYNFH